MNNNKKNLKTHHWVSCRGFWQVPLLLGPLLHLHLSKGGGVSENSWTVAFIKVPVPRGVNSIIALIVIKRAMGF